ncbi:D-3-phosphoglycerate dehydrogenase [Saccharopolyspora erythraea NRRL 2338]|uniref:D-3-phosphoglycerate dehydrogenase n=2 Tax=Saccharopolyspora erythraea TaxID=1836 RepID=A4FHH0_SACEN|nr:3-phosphoglycerate dehydrogenase [Saccharopolyspora erythraea]EQD81698.1 2-hydroxyacid dehydrogenase [Saccharopolyspora erythraea D]PFG97190.1 D-3-phosphoglycerate dehydrogenase [Saccharopolyspora erythraea NRRL 2338]QRK87391.1 hydroxyacid dehydrogenase [Saccharopolyspora erythraea]CAM03495.1 D-3-phosphoglycerate dehydrogenase [Saccharopolyspora erythraea NRRL 2338]
MRVLLADAFPAEHVSALTEHGHDCDYQPDTTTEQLPDRLTGREVLVVRSTAVPSAVIEAADSLRLVIRAGSGTNTIDCESAAERGVHVCNVPGRNAIAVAELAFALMLALDRSVCDNVDDLRAGRWDKKRYSRARGIHGRRVGVVGLGQIGLAFAERAAAFGATVHAVAKPGRSPKTAERADAIGIRFVDDLTTLARTCDVLSLHVPATSATRNLVDADLLAHVQPGTIILNTSRGELVDEDALIAAMEEKDVRAGIDVFTDEPATGTGHIGSRLARHPNVYGTHHIGASTEQAQHAVAAEVVRMVDAFESGSVLNCVNLDAVRLAQSTTRSGEPS